MLESVSNDMPWFRPDEAEDVLSAPPPLVEMLPVGIYACEAGGRVRWFNRRAAELWGRSPAIGDDDERFCGSYELYSLDGSMISREETPMAYALRTGQAISGRTAVVKRPDGERYTAMVHINPLRDRAGHVIGAINCFHAVEDDPDEERSVRDSERQLRQLLGAIPAAIYTTDAKGRITFYNEAAVDLSGRRPELGHDSWCVTWKLFRPDGTSLPHDQCPMAVCLREGIAVRGVEAVAERPDGTRVPFLPYPTPIHDEAGELIGAVNMLVDVSERKEAETQQRLLFAELNHRIKNNMQMLYALLSSGRREAASEEARLALTEAMQRVGAMAAAQAVLYQSNKAASFAADEFVRAVCASAAANCVGTIHLTCDCAVGDLSNDTAVPLALIIAELVTNAGKHARNGQGEATVGVRLGEDGDMLRLIVEDDGPGFEFGQVLRRSSGLGLVTGLARQINGTFSVERGGGARCVLRFRDRHGFG